MSHGARVSTFYPRVHSYLLSTSNDVRMRRSLQGVHVPPPLSQNIQTSGLEEVLEESSLRVLQRVRRLGFAPSNSRVRRYGCGSFAAASQWWSHSLNADAYGCGFYCGQSPLAALP